MNRPHRMLPLLAIAVAPLACSPAGAQGTKPNAPSADRLRLATTTSVENSGLLKELVPEFERATGIRVHVLAVGSGMALELGRRGDVDAVLVHSPAAEQEFVAQGMGAGRAAIMRNGYVLVGPAADPAGIRGLEPIAALRRIAAGSATFVSRGDDSGTHIREKELWDQAGARPAVDRYLEVGQGMAATLRMAAEKGAYTLTDTGTYLFLGPKLELVTLVERGEALENVYSVMWVSPEKHPGVRFDSAREFVSWLTSRSGQTAIGAYRVAGTRLFEPIARGGDARRVALESR